MPIAATRPDDPLSAYFAAVGVRRGDPLLSAAEEIDLGRRYAAGDKAAGDRLATENLRLVAHIAARLKRPGRDLDDRIADGMLGLLRAVERWDPGRGFRFSTYATWWIKNFIARGAEDAGLIRVPCYAQELARKWSGVIDRLRGDLGREPTDEEVARASRLPERARGHATRAFGVLGMVRFERSQAEDVRERVGPDGYLGRIGDEGPGPGESAEAAEATAGARAMLAGLPPREAEILRRRFGIDGPEETLREIGRSLGLTRERVRQIEVQALARLRGDSGHPGPPSPLRALSARLGGPN